MQVSLKESAVEVSKMQREFESLAFPLIDRIYNTAIRMTRDHHDAEDLVQNTYLKAWRYFNGFERGTNFAGWILRILTNNFINDYRKKQLQPRRADIDTTLETVGNSDTTLKDDSTELHLKYDELFDDTISTALQELPPDFRIVVLLSDVNEFQYKEISKMIGCPIGTVMSRLHRGRKMLSNFLGNYALEAWPKSP